MGLLRKSNHWQLSLNLSVVQAKKKVAFRWLACLLLQAYAIMSAQCMDFEGEETLLPPPQCKESDLHAMSPRQSAKRSAAQASSDAFWLSILAENGPVNISTICSQMKRRQTEVQERLERWNEQEWEEEDLKSNGESSDPPKQ